MKRVEVALVCLIAVVLGRAKADEIAMLPVGDPARAYLLASGNAGEVIDCRDVAGKGPATFEAMIADLAKADVVLIGENHTNGPGHQFEERVVRALAESGRPMVLGMEFFEVTDDAALARYVRGETDLRTMLEETAWYGPSGGNYNFAYYQPLVDAMKEKKQAVRGVNVPREWVRAVSRGTEAQLTEEQRAYLPDAGPIDERHRHVINRMMGGFGASMPEMFNSMYRGQTTWDAAMAASVLRIRSEAGSEGTGKPLVVVIVGVGHVGHGLGIPARLKAADGSLEVRVVAPVSAERPAEDARVHPGFEAKETATFSRGYGDYVYVLPDTGGEKLYPELGVRFSHPKDAASPTALPLEISTLVAGGIGERGGLRKGDRVVSIDGVEVRSIAEAAVALSSLRWEQVVRFGVLRTGEGEGGEMSVMVGVVPATDGEEDWLKSRIGYGVLESFDPASDRAYPQTGKEKPATPHARVVMFREKAVRIDVMNGAVLMQSWKLDASGRPVLGVLPTPAADGAVRVEITRDDAGKVTSQVRRDREGREIKS